jgi:hypothetical protein
VLATIKQIRVSSVSLYSQSTKILASSARILVTINKDFGKFSEILHSYNQLEKVASFADTGHLLYRYWLLSTQTLVAHQIATVVTANKDYGDFSKMLITIYYYSQSQSTQTLVSSARC